MAGTGIGDAIGGGGDAFQAAFGSDELKNQYWNKALQETYNRRLPTLEGDLDAYNKSLADFEKGNQLRYGQLGDIGRQNRQRYQDLGFMATSPLYDPGNINKDILGQYTGALDKYTQSMWQSGRANRDLAAARLGQGGVRGGSFIDIGIPASYAPSMANAFTNVLGMVGPTAQGIHQGRIGNLGVAGDFASRLPETVMYNAGMELLPAQARQMIRSGDLGILSQFGDAYKNNIAGLVQDRNWADRFGGVMQGLGRSAEGAASAYMNYLTGGAYGMKGGGSGSGKGGGGGGGGGQNVNVYTGGSGGGSGGGGGGGSGGGGGGGVGTLDYGQLSQFLGPLLNRGGGNQASGSAQNWYGGGDFSGQEGYDWAGNLINNPWE